MTKKNKGQREGEKERERPSAYTKAPQGADMAHGGALVNSA